MNFIYFNLILLFAGFAAVFVFSIGLMASLSPLVLFAKSGNPPKVITFPLLVVAGIYQIYFWGLWSAFCVAVTIQFTQNPAVTWHWLYWIFGFMWCTSLIGWLAHKEQQSSQSVDEVRRVNKGSRFYSLIAIIAFLVFAFTPSVMFLPYGWALLGFARYIPEQGPKSVFSKLEEEYFRTLDDWVQRGGPVDEVRNTVVWTCRKLVMLAASTQERVAFLTIRREEHDFRVDVCAKMTANRVYPQPEFQTDDLVALVCDKTRLELFTKMCKRSGLR